MASFRLWYKSLLVAGMFVYGMIAVGAIMPLLGFLAGRRAAAIHDRIRLNWNRTICRILNVHLEIHGEPNEDAQLLIANHISWLDIIAIGSQQPVTFVAKQEVAAWPVMGYLARRTGTLFVRRGDADQTAAIAEQMTWLLRQGKRIMLFPEGTTTTGERVLRFHSRLFQPAQLAQVRVQAVALAYRGEVREIAPFIGEDEFLPHLLRLLRRQRIDIHLHYCPPLPASLHRDVLAQTTRKQIVSAIVPETAEGRRTVGL
ncbi:MAG TPA: lysophospholipid acyltransferase family protein [Methylococcaceae bacterium]|jgi:1-acyl-sn-glycerol-3-phosphate acyltransferase|nr:lysophospholipid acyltransferase family protein [Methylococcaceae bacterium]